MSHSDQSQRFLFDDIDVCDEMVDLERGYSEVLAEHPYPEPVAQLLGEMLVAVSLFCDTLKFDDLLVLQARSSDAVPLLMVECSSDRQVRGLARYSAESIGADAGIQELMPEGVLTFTVDPIKGQRYQGIVALEGVNLAECLLNYFTNSEQLPIRLWSSANDRRARGLLLQQLPTDHLKDPEVYEVSWQHLTILVDMLTAEELLTLDNETVLHRPYHEEIVRLFEPQPLVFHCSCSRERSANALVDPGQVDCERLLEEEEGSITIDCQFCNQRYLLDASDAAQLFASAGSQGLSETRYRRFFIRRALLA